MFNITLECPQCSNGDSSLSGLLISKDADAQLLREDPFTSVLNSGVEMVCGCCGHHWISTDAVEGYREVANQILNVATGFHERTVYNRSQMAIRMPLKDVPGGILDSRYIDPTKGF